MDKTTRNNIIKLWCGGAFKASAGSFLSVLSVFYLFYGMTEMQISFHASITQILGLAVSLSCSGIASGFRDSRKPIVAMLVARAILVIGYTLFCFWTAPVNFFYICMLIIGSLLSIEASLRLIFDYKLPCEVIDIKYYAVYTGYSNLFNGIMSTTIGVLLPIFYNIYDFVAVTQVCLIAASACYLLEVFFNLALRPIKQQDTEQKSGNTLRINPLHDLNMLMHNKDFLALLIPNVLRGFGAGVLSLLVVIVIREFSITEGEATIISSVTGIATLASSVIYVYMEKLLGSPRTCLVGSLMFGACCIAMLGGFTQFLVLYGVAYIGYNIVSNVIPNMVYQSVDQSIISPFHTWRLALTNLGTALITPVYGFIMPLLSGFWLMAISFIFIFLCSAGYYIHYKNKLKKEVKA